MPKVAAFLAILSLFATGVCGEALLAEEPSSAQADEAPGQEMLWSGYLFRDGDERIRLGWPVVAMGVMAMPAHVVEGPLASRLAPLLTDVEDDYVFWNYDLEARGDGALEGIPRTLVTLRGHVTLERPNDEHYGSYQGGTRTMRDARLVSVEFLDEAWLRHWGRIFRDRDSPFRIDLDRGTITDAELQAFAKKALPILLGMHKMAPPGEAETKRAHTIDARARVVKTHRRQTERSLQRWLADMKTKHPDLRLAGLETLPPLPPSSVELQRLFLASETRAAFLESVRKLWTGDLASLDLPCYVTEGSSTRWTEVDLRTIQRMWSEQEFQARRALTQRMVGR